MKGVVPIYPYITISGAGGIGKTTAIATVADYLSNIFPDVETTGDIVLPGGPLNPLQTIKGIVDFKTQRDENIRSRISAGAMIVADRSCFDPLALAMTVLPRQQLEEIMKMYEARDFAIGHHVLLTARRSVIAARRAKRGSSPIPGLSRFSDIPLEQYERIWDENWRQIHLERRLRYYEVDYSSEDFEENFARLLDVVASIKEEICRAERARLQ